MEQADDAMRKKDAEVLLLTAQLEEAKHQLAEAKAREQRRKQMGVGCWWGGTGVS